MTISQTRAYYGLRSTVTPTSPSSSGSLNVGIASSNINLPAVNTTYSIQSLIMGSASDLVVNLASGEKTGTTAWTAGVAQVETATAAGTITLAGNATITVTASGMTNSPKAISVAVALSDTAATWSGKVRAALAADVDVSAMFTVGGSTTAISLTRKPLATYTVGSVPVPTYPANDATLNIASANGTCTGITAATTSTNTTTGVLSAGCYVVGDGEDFEGNAFSTLNSIMGLVVNCHSETVSGISVVGAFSSNSLIPPGGIVQIAAPDVAMSVDTYTIEPSGTVALITLVVSGN